MGLQVTSKYRGWTYAVVWILILPASRNTLHSILHSLEALPQETFGEGTGGYMKEGEA